MFQVTTQGANRLNIELADKLDSNDMKAAIDDLVVMSEGIEHGKMFYQIRDFKLPTLGAIAVEFSRLPKLLNLVRKFDRIAVVADQEWVQKASEIEGALIPGLQIKAFDSDEEEDAEQWLAAKSDSAATV